MILTQVKIFRVEHRKWRTGPYISGPVGAAPDNNARAPSFSLEVLDRNLVFGFATREQFVEWFSLEECQLLDDAGFVLAEYRVDQAVADERQAVFDPQRASLVGIERLSVVWNREIVDRSLEQLR